MAEKMYLDFHPMTAYGDWPEGSVAVLSRRRREALGVISWYAPWRLFVFEAKPDTVWSAGCLAQVQARIEAMTAEKRKAS